VANLNTKTFTQVIEDFAAAVQATASGLVDLSVGAILRALGEAQAAVALWLQAEIIFVLSVTRLATSQGSWVDSFIADFFDPSVFARLGAQPSVGEAVFARFTASGQVVVRVGSTAATADGSQKFVVTLDTTNGAYNAGLGGYVMANTVASVTVPAQALTSGSASNVLPDTINTITSPITGVDTVNNPSAFVGGTDPETTLSLLKRFVSQILSLRQATVAAVLNAAGKPRTGLSLLNVEGVNPDNSVHKGFFYVVVDDGTGFPSSDLRNAVTAQVNATRADGIEFAVIAPTVITANVLFGIDSTMMAPAADETAAENAVMAYINALPIGATLILTRLIQVAYDSSPTIANIIGLTINGGTSDVAAAVPHVVKAGTVTATAS
jgi:Baseplate J-like protein